MTALLSTAIAIAIAAPSHTTLLNDAQHPLPAAALTRLQHAVDTSALPTPAAPTTISAEVTESVGCGLAGDHYIQLAKGCWTPFALLHELAHESQMFDGAGSVMYPDENYGAGAVGWTDTKISTLALLLHRPISTWDADTSQPLNELAADAYAECALHPHWHQWWGHWTGRASRTRTRTWHATPTPYDFRAGPIRYRQICEVLAGP